MLEACIAHGPSSVFASCTIQIAGAPWAGVAILHSGGSAVDAAVATALCQGIYNPQASGIGGGTFMLIHSPNGSFEVIDAREPAPAAASTDMYAGGPVTNTAGSCGTDTLAAAALPGLPGA